MSFREKSAWISMLSMIAIYGWYFFALLRSPGAHGADDFHSGSLLVWTIVVLVAVQIVLHVAVAIRKPNEAKAPRDEREKAIDLKATRIAFYGLASGVALACFFGAQTPPVLFNTNSLLFILVAAEVLRSASQILYSRLSV